MLYRTKLSRRFYRIYSLTLFILAVSFFSCQAAKPALLIRHLGEGQSIVQIEERKRFLLLPIEEAAPEAKIYMMADYDVINTLNVRLSVTKVDYYVPVDLASFAGKQLSFNFQLIADTAHCWKEMKLADSFDTSNRESLRPTYHFTPPYGWMNDPNGMFYKDGVYHLYYQYNPYGSMWGNMHWGHATTKDLIHWTHEPVAISPDALGYIFSGSCVVDNDNTAGFGAGAVIAFYTSASDRQVQSMAYSLDNGKTFKKYNRNPILTSTQRDFRDPKVVWHAPSQRWVMVLAVGQEMQFFTSSNLKDWTLESKFGEGQGAHGGVWECPDLIEVPIEGTQLKKWVLICNINPGGPFGGSATQYFVGSFDGKRFVNESPSTTKWMDWGKDHYATVTWNNAPEGRHIALAWMSNWEYANNVPTTQFRSANSLPRDLTLYTSEGETYLKSAPSPEMLKLRNKKVTKRPFNVDRTYNIDRLLPENNGVYEIEMTIQRKKAEVIGFLLFNANGEEVEVSYNVSDKSLSVDRSKSGDTSFSNSFAAVTAAPVEDKEQLTLRIFVDKCSMELFGNDGRFCMSNLIFPSTPYNRISFYSKGGSYTVSAFNVYY